MTDRFILVLVGALAIILVVVVVEGMSGPGNTTQATSQVVAQTVSPTTTTQHQTTSYIPSSTAPPSPVGVFVTSSSSVSNTTVGQINIIQDSDLNSLASMVHLGQAKQTSPNKDKWTQAIPVAQKLLEGPCDCEQRNWLNQFVTMGNYALAGSPKYYDWAKLMDSLPLSDQNVASRYVSN